MRHSYRVYIPAVNNTTLNAVCNTEQKELLSLLHNALQLLYIMENSAGAESSLRDIIIQMRSIFPNIADLVATLYSRQLH